MYYIGANSFEYLTELQRHAQELAASPAEWMPWNYREAQLLMAAGDVSRVRAAPMWRRVNALKSPSPWLGISTCLRTVFSKKCSPAGRCESGS